MNEIVHHFKVDCVWGEFGEWSACTKTCGGGIKAAKRIITQQSFGGGRNCTGEYQTIEYCNFDECPSKQTN